MNRALAAAALLASAAIFTSPAHADPATRLLHQWAADNEQCRGRSGDDPRTWTFCSARDRDGKKLEALGWCYGEPDQYEYQKEWHKCASTTTARASRAEVPTSTDPTTELLLKEAMDPTGGGAVPAISDYPVDRSQYKNVGDLSQYSELVITPEDAGHKIEAIGYLEVADAMAELDFPGHNHWDIIRVLYRQLPQDMIDELRQQCPIDIRCVGRWDLTLIGPRGKGVNQHELVRLDGWAPLSSTSR